MPYMQDRVILLNFHRSSRVFSMSLGLMFTGIAIGPTIGSLLVRFTGEPISVFFLAASLHLTYALFVSLAVPESLTKDKMQAARNKHEDLSRESTDTLSVVRYVKGVFRFLAPLAVIAPMDSGRGGKDWTLTFIILAYGLAISLMVRIFDEVIQVLK
jgi:MFS family permease